MFGSQAEEKIASTFPSIRMMSVKKTQSNRPTADLAAIDLVWGVASNGNISLLYICVCIYSIYIYIYIYCL